MTREDLVKTIKLFLDARYMSDNHTECAEKLLAEYEAKIRADVIEEFKERLLKNNVVDKSVVRRVAEQLKEQK